LLKVNIDGREVEVEKGSTILKAAEEIGITIPTLCHLETIEPYGACRLCIVEVSAGNRPKIVTSCNYPIQEDGLTVKTDSEKIIKYRKLLVELLLSRCPESAKIQDLAHEMGVEKPRFKLEDEKCILCGLCVRACHEIVGTNSIGFANRGANRKVTTPFNDSSSTCIGCGACAYVCPTGAIKIEDTEETRTMINWKTVRKLKKCKLCGKYFAPEFQLEYMKRTADLPNDYFEKCLECRTLRR